MWIDFDRLRVLCQTNDCPVCRADMEEVYFVTDVAAFEELKNSQPQTKVKFAFLRTWLNVCWEAQFCGDDNFHIICSQIDEFGIFFENEEINAKFTELLTNKCWYHRNEPSPYCCEPLPGF